MLPHSMYTYIHEYVYYTYVCVYVCTVCIYAQNYTYACSYTNNNKININAIYELLILIFLVNFNLSHFHGGQR